MVAVGLSDVVLLDQFVDIASCRQVLHHEPDRFGDAVEAGPGAEMAADTGYCLYCVHGMEPGAEGVGHEPGNPVGHG